MTRLLLLAALTAACRVDPPAITHDVMEARCVEALPGKYAAGVALRAGEGFAGVIEVPATRMATIWLPSADVVLSVAACRDGDGMCGSTSWVKLGRRVEVACAAPYGYARVDYVGMLQGTAYTHAGL